jgi:AraC family transcriptional regulator of adaptative response / DNA-3-methyladenine glycosylase II
MLDEERCYRAVQSRDQRFDGWFYVAVLTTRIYCRPSCPAVTPKRANVCFYPTAAAAHSAGFRACKRCRPDAAPGSPEWNVRADVVARAMRAIADGVVEREGVPGLAGNLGYSERHLHRLLVAELGAGALAIARAQRAQTARVLLETTELPVTHVAHAAGFSSVRQFNATIREVFAMSPSALRSARRDDRHDVAPGAGAISLRLPFRAPFAAAELFGFLAARAVSGVETGDHRSYRRSLTLPHGSGTIALEPGEQHVRCTLRLDDLRDLGTAVQRARRLLDLDADPRAVDDMLGADPLLERLIARRAGLRAPGHVDAAELAIRAVLGQQVSVAGARTTTAKLVRMLGEELQAPDGGLTHTFPRPETLAAADPSTFPMPSARARSIVRLAAALATGEITLDAGTDRDEAAEQLLALPGIGPWTVAYIRMRGLGDPDEFLPTDLGARRALDALGGTVADAERWQPWRSYALHHLWASLAPSSGASLASPRTSRGTHARSAHPRRVDRRRQRSTTPPR